MRYLLGVIAVAALPLLNGCAAVAVGGAAAGGYLVGEDRRAAQTMAQDQAIEFRAKNLIVERHPNANVNITSYNHLVLLTGQAPDAASRAAIEKIVQGLERVRGIYNEIQVAPVSSFSARASDSYVTSKVKARFLDARRFNPIHVKVVSESGTVYLMGLVKPAEANAATELARTTSGVQRVVRLLEIQE